MLHFWSINKVLAWIKKAFSDSVYTLWVLQGAKVKQLVNKFNNAVETLDQSKLIQISSEALSVNLKFYKWTAWRRRSSVAHWYWNLCLTYNSWELKKLNYFFRVENWWWFKMAVKFTQRKSSQKGDLQKKYKW